MAPVGSPPAGAAHPGVTVPIALLAVLGVLLLVLAAFGVTAGRVSLALLGAAALALAYFWPALAAAFH